MAHSYEHRFDPHIHRRGYLPGHDYALPHLSRFTQRCTPDELELLGHVSCGLLSTPGVPPTLLALKQHAQSLCYLIAMLEPHHGEATEVDGGRANGLGDHDDDHDHGDDDDDDDMKAADIDPDDMPRADPSGPLPVPGLVHPDPWTGKKKTKAKTKSHKSKANNKASKGKPGNNSKGAASSFHPFAAHDPLTSNPFDWLEDLTTPYTSDDPDHHRPLFDLVNEVHARHDVLGTTYRCPLETYRARAAGPYERGADGDTDEEQEDEDEDEDEDYLDRVQDGDIVRPYASHHNLLMHANMCLERLDHEYAATGGLLSMLPTGEAGGQAEPGAPDAASASADASAFPARNSLLGQWLIFTQQLVGRMHELEIAYGHALTALSGEASVPGRVARPGGGQGVPRDQDRWILANAGDDVWSYLHALLDRAGQGQEERHAAWRAGGVAGGTTAGGTPAGLVHVDVNTRFYRVGADKGPLFVCPAWSAHPGIQPAGRALESTPAVVVLGGNGSVHGRTQATALERRYETQLRAAGRLVRQNERLAERVRALEVELRARTE